MKLITVPPGYVWEDMPFAETEFLGNTSFRTKENLGNLLGVLHAFNCLEADGGPVGLVQPSHWNAQLVAKARRVRLEANLHAPGAAGAVLGAQYSLNGIAWSYLDGVAGPVVPVDVAGHQLGALVTVVAPALADVFLRLVGLGGDGVVDPKFYGVSLQTQGL